MVDTGTKTGDKQQDREVQKLEGQRQKPKPDSAPSSVTVTSTGLILLKELKQKTQANTVKCETGLSDKGALDTANVMCM